MSDPNPWAQQFDETADSPAKKPMSGCLRFVIILSGLGLLSAFVCCGFVGWIVSLFYPTMTKIPAEIVAVSRQIADMEIPEGFSPASAFTIDNLYMTVRVAEFQQREGKGDLLIAQTTLKVGKDNNIAVDQSNQFRTNSEVAIRKRIEVRKAETHKITVFGEQVSITVNEGVDRDEEQPTHLASTEFTHANNQYFFLIRMDDDIWDQDAVFKMLENAKAP